MHPASKFCLSFSLEVFFCIRSHWMKGVSILLELKKKKKVLWSSKFCSLPMELGKSKDEPFAYEEVKIN